MLISYPFLPARGVDATDDEYEKTILDMEMLNAGVYPSSREREWHGGIHVQAPNMIEPVRAIADGTIVAYRLNSELTKEREEDEEGRIDNSFVLIKHETQSDSLQDANGAEQPVEVVFYSLYMHLMNTGEVRKRGIDAKAIHASITASGNAVKPGNGAKIYRKDIIGYPGESYSTAGMIHFEIFTTDDALSKFFVDSKNASEIGTKGTWGDSYFVVKAGSPVRADHPSADKGKIGGHRFPTGTPGNVDSARNLFVRIAYRKGVKYTTTWIDEGQDKAPTLLTSEEGVPDDGYEYAMYNIATALYKSCPSAGMELLRMGKMIGPDKDKLSAADTHNWQLVTYASGQRGYIDLADSAVIAHVLSDADFPYWLGWQKHADGLFGSSGQCEMHDLLDVLKVSRESEDSDTARQQLRDYFNDGKHRHVREWARRLVCRYPSEWDKANNARCGKLKEKDGLAPSKDGPYFGNDGEYEKHMQFVESLQWWGDAGLGDSNVWHFHPFGFIRQFRKCGWLSADEIGRSFPPTALRPVSVRPARWVSEPVRIPTRSRLDAMAPALNRAMHKYGISTRLRATAFLGNAMVETRWFAALEEDGSGQRYYPWKGRGFIHLTWPDNYIKYWRFRGRSIADSLTKALHDAAAASDRERDNAALARVESRVPVTVQDWRNEMSDTGFDAADSAGAYWLWSGAASLADAHPVFFRMTELVDGKQKSYYRCESFGQVAATVNLGSPNNRLSGVNGLVARYQACASILRFVGDRIPFPRVDGSLHDTPEW